jgi:RNA polymerase sigma-70 factor, ECF subfamily
VYYQVGDKMTAEDITEEVFVKGWKAIQTCRGREETFVAWLYRIAHNQVIDTFRQSNRNLHRDDIDIADDTSPEYEAETRMEKQQVLAAVLRLPETQKQVILLKFLEGADNTEIGRIMGKRQGAIRALQMRALAGLKRMLESKGKQLGE